MKHIIALLFAFACYQADAQNLQFSQVLTFSGYLGSDQAAEFIVPEGKVWKIVSAENYYTSYQVNGASAIRSIPGGSQDKVQNNVFPIWIKSNDVLTANGGGISGSSFFLSIIEFTLVP